MRHIAVGYLPQNEEEYERLRDANEMRLVVVEKTQQKRGESWWIWKTFVENPFNDRLIVEIKKELKGETFFGLLTLQFNRMTEIVRNSKKCPVRS